MVSYYAMKKDTPFTIAGRTFSSRLLVGSGKYKDLEETRLATEKSGSEIITVAIRRTNIGQNPNDESLLMSFRLKNIQSFQIQLVVTMPKMLSEHVN